MTSQPSNEQEIKNVATDANIPENDNTPETLIPSESATEKSTLTKDVNSSESSGIVSEDNVAVKNSLEGNKQIVASDNLQEAVAPSPVQWEEIDFPGKEFCVLTEDNQIALKATPYSPERKLSLITLTNLETMAPALTEKFSEAKAKADELEKEWQDAEDKVKLIGKVARLKEYLLQANAIGDFALLFGGIEAKEKNIHEHYEANYKIKEAIAEKAASLKDSEEWREATEGFRSIVEEWKNAPPVQKHKSEALWQKIEEARNHFYERKRVHQEDVEKDMMQNLDLKLEICEQSEALAASEEWRKTSDKMKELFDKWKTIGRVATNEKNEELWTRFSNARNAFFERKKSHYENIQSEQENNYNLKLALVEKAEGMQDSGDWKKTTDEYAHLMEEWKTIGKVPAEKSDELWGRLQKARDTFFSAKRQSAEEYKLNLEDNYAQKSALVARAEQIKDSTEWRETTDELNELMTEWKKIGYVAREHGDDLWERFIAVRKHFFDRKDADRDKRKARIQGQMQTRLKQTKDFLKKIKNELQEDEDRLADFKESLANTNGTGAKEEELRNHLQNLIQQIEKKLPNRQAKVNDVEAQLASLEKNNIEGRKDKPSQS